MSIQYSIFKETKTIPIICLCFKIIQPIDKTKKTFKIPFFTWTFLHYTAFLSSPYFTSPVLRIHLLKQDYVHYISLCGYHYPQYPPGISKFLGIIWCLRNVSNHPKISSKWKCRKADQRKGLSLSPFIYLSIDKEWGKHLMDLA